MSKRELVLRIGFCVCGLFSSSAFAQSDACATGVVYEDRNGNAVRDKSEPGVAAVAVSDGERLVRTDAQGRYALPAIAGRTVFVVKPATHALGKRADGLPDFWRHRLDPTQPALKYGGMQSMAGNCDFALYRQRVTASRGQGLQVLIFGDPQPKSLIDVNYYRRDIIEAVMGDSTAHPASRDDLGLTLGDVVNDDLSLYPAMNSHTAKLGVPWLHVAGNHDLDLDASNDAQSLLSFRNSYGPDTLAWEEPEATFIVLDDVLYQPTQRPAYIGGLREDQFAFLQAYLAGAQKERLLVLAMHIPLFEAEGKDTFRDADRKRLFALLKPFPKLLLLTAHNHTQQHVLHTPASGWHGAKPLHEYNVGATCGAFWSGVKDAQGIPDATMADGTPNGYARLKVQVNGQYTLRYYPARDAATSMRLHAPRVLRRGAYPAWGIYANVWMGMDDTPVEFRVDGGVWQPMRRVLQADPWLLAENARDDEAAILRGYDRSPEATPSAHVWRGALPTDLPLGEHRIQVRARDPWQGQIQAEAIYRLDDASP